MWDGRKGVGSKATGIASRVEVAELVFGIKGVQGRVPREEAQSRISCRKGGEADNERENRLPLMG